MLSDILGIGVSLDRFLGVAAEEYLFPRRNHQISLITGKMLVIRCN